MGETIDLSPTEELTNIEYHETDFEDCTFIDSHRHPKFLWDCTFERCSFDLRQSQRAFSLRNCTFSDCDFHFRRATRWTAYVGVRFEHCRFTGQLSNSRFGHLDYNEPVPGLRPKQISHVRDCDFSKLNIDDTEFHGEDPLDSCKLPGWPVIGYVELADKQPLPEALQELPDDFHRKAYTDIRARRSVMVVNLSKVSVTRSQIETVAKKTGRIILFDD